MGIFRFGGRYEASPCYLAVAIIPIHATNTPCTHRQTINTSIVLSLALSAGPLGPTPTEPCIFLQAEIFGLPWDNLPQKNFMVSSQLEFSKNADGGSFSKYPLQEGGIKDSCKVYFVLFIPLKVIAFPFFYQRRQKTLLVLTSQFYNLAFHF